MRKIRMAFVTAEAHHEAIREILSTITNYPVIEETELYVKLQHPGTEKPQSFYLIYAQNGSLCFPPELEGPITSPIAKNAIPYTIHHRICHGYESFEKDLVEFGLTPLSFW